jgi:capsular polysaccharide biosynthesis protein
MASGITSGAPGAQPSGDASGLNLNDILNILWRRGPFILSLTVLGALAGVVYGISVTPLHRATLTVQPGITSFNNDSRPEREWRIKDVAQWYKRGNFNPELAKQLRKDARKFRPTVFAQTIPRGPQSAGGNTITLTTLSADRSEAEAILNSSVEVFNSFASSDSLHSNVGLMRSRTLANIGRRQAKIAQIEGERKRIALRINASQVEKEALQASEAILDVKIAELETTQLLIDASAAAYQAALTAARGDMGTLESDLERWETIGEELATQRQQILAGSGGTDPVALMLASNSIGDLLSDLGELRLGIIDRSGQILEWSDELRRIEMEASRHRTEIDAARFERNVSLPQKLNQLDNNLAELEVQRDFDLVRTVDEDQQELKIMVARLNALSPLEAIGEATSSVRPVRPRKMRAVSILAALAFVSSIFAAFVLEYLSNNWREITRRA